MKNKGFTLIELMIVIAIIGILSAVAIPNFINARDKGRITAAISALRIIQTGLELYMANIDIYPTCSEDDLVRDGAKFLDQYISSAEGITSTFQNGIDIYTTNDNGSIYTVIVTCKNRLKTKLRATAGRIDKQVGSSWEQL